MGCRARATRCCKALLFVAAVPEQTVHFVPPKAGGHVSNSTLIAGNVMKTPVFESQAELDVTAISK